MRAGQPTTMFVAVAGIAVLVIVGIIVLVTYNGNPNAIGNMPGEVQQVLNTATLSGQDIARNILTITGNRADIRRNIIPGDYSYGPVENEGDDTYYVNLNVPINMKGIKKLLGYSPHISQSTVSSASVTDSSTLSFDDYIMITPLPNESYDRLYFDPKTHVATFSFKLMPNGTVVDESWDAVAVNS